MRTPYLVSRTGGFLRHAYRLYRAARQRGHAQEFRRRFARLATASITRFEGDLHHWAATLEGLDNPVMGQIEEETRGLDALLEDDGFSSAVVVFADSLDRAMLHRCLESIQRQSTLPSAVFVIANSDSPIEEASWSDQIPTRFVAARTASWSALFSETSSTHLLLIDGDHWLRPDLLFRYRQICQLLELGSKAFLACAPLPTNGEGEVIGRPLLEKPHRPNPPLLLAHDWLNSGVLVSADLLGDLDLLQPVTDGVLALSLRLMANGLHPVEVPVGLRARPLVDARPRARSANLVSVVEHFLSARRAQGLKASSEGTSVPLAVSEASLQVVIPFRDRLQMTKAAIRSVEDQAYPGAVMITAVDNGSRADPTTVLGETSAELLRIDEPFNFSRLCNRAAARSDSEFILFLNNDVILEPGTLSAMADWCEVPSVGAVGAILSYPNGTLQHSGIVRDPFGPAHEQRWTLPERGLDSSQLTSTLEPRVVDAVTGACLMTRRSVFRDVGGFSEALFPNAFSDTDLCQRIGELGLYSVVTPRARGVHDESASRRYDRLENFEGSAWLETLAQESRTSNRATRKGAPGIREGDQVSLSYGSRDLGPLARVPIEVVVSSGTVTPEQAREWLSGGGLIPLRVLGLNSEGKEAWSVVDPAVEGPDNRAGWVGLTQDLRISRQQLERFGLVALTEDVEAVVSSGDASDICSSGESEQNYEVGVFKRSLSEEPVRPEELSAKDLVRVVPRPDRQPPSKSTDKPDTDRYKVEHSDGRVIACRRSWYGLAQPARDRPFIVVTVPYLATGGAEQTLFELLRSLADEYRFVVATLVEPRDELGDRSEDFTAVADYVIDLGELFAPQAIPYALAGIVALTGAKLLYNANGCDIFYRAAKHLKSERPSVKIVDHLFDHVEGYISYYSATSQPDVDLCVAENHKIANSLEEEREWPRERTEVIWPCGRLPANLPHKADRERIRSQTRRQLGFDAEDLVFLTAARLHPQKRPLDVLALAQRLGTTPKVYFLWVGGGELENEFDQAVSNGSGQVSRLPFRTDIPDLILASDVGLLVSAYEGLPVFMIECLQLGRPFLCTDVGDVARVLEQGPSGIVSGAPGDLDALAEGVERLRDPALRLELAKNGAAISSRFAPEVVSQSYKKAWIAGTKLAADSPAGLP